MERETGFQYPCLADIRKNCPMTCRLHQKSVSLILKSANDAGKTPEKFLGTLRSGTQEMAETFNRMNVRILRDSLLLEECQNILDGKINYIDILKKS